MPLLLLAVSWHGVGVVAHCCLLSVVSVVVRSCLGVCMLGHHYCLLVVCVDVRVCLLACGCCFWRGQQRAAAEVAERKRVADEQVLGALQSLCVVAGINAGERERKVGVGVWVWVCGGLHPSSSLLFALCLFV